MEQKLSVFDAKAFRKNKNPEDSLPFGAFNLGNTLIYLFITRNREEPCVLACGIRRLAEHSVTSTWHSSCRQANAAASHA
jgi:hypothetical protein